MEESAEWDRALNEMHERIKMEKTFMEEDRAQAKGLADSIGWSLNGL